MEKNNPKDDEIDDRHYVFDFTKSREENLRAYSAFHAKNGKPLLNEQEIQDILKNTL